MLSEYIKAALRHATCEQLSGDGSWYCEIPELPGVWANADTEAQAREDLRQALEGWIVLRLRMQQSIPAIDGVTLSFARVA